MVEEEKKKKAPRPKAKKEEAPKEQPKEAEAPKAEAKPEAPKEAPKAEPKAEKAEAPKEPKKRRKGGAKKPAARVFVARGKRKESIARATISAGKGVVRFNSMNLESLSNRYVKDIIREPLRYIGPGANDIDISVSVNGGGMMGQAQAARTAIAHALVMYFDEMGLKQKFADIDRSLIVEDTRRVEPKKFRGPKARARFQKSYR